MNDGSQKTIRETDVGIIMNKLDTVKDMALDIKNRAGALHVPFGDQKSPDVTEPITVGERIIYQLDDIHTVLSVALSSLQEFN